MLSQKRIKNLVMRPEFFVFITICILSVVIHLKSGLFFTNNNIVDILRSMTVPSIFALSAFLGFINTGPDVSFPLIAALSSYLATQFAITMGGEVSMVLVFLVAILFGVIMGAVNGFIIARYNFPSLIVTLGTTSIFSGLLLGFFEATRLELPATMAKFGDLSLIKVVNAETNLGSTLPMTFLIFVGLYILVYLFLNFTMLGRGVYAVGGDEVAAERAGFNVKWIRFGVFALSGGIAAIAGVSFTVESSYFLPTEFAGKEMIVIAAVILGGTRLFGGVGTLTGCLLGTLLLTIVSNSLILLGVPVYWQTFLIGAIIIVGTALSVIQSHRTGKVSKAEESNDEKVEVV